MESASKNRFLVPAVWEFEAECSSCCMWDHCSQGYLFRFCSGDEEDVCHVPRDEDHGGESHEPADPLTPGREHVVIHRQRNHLYGAEQKHSLMKTWRLGRVWEKRFSLSELVYLSSPFLCSSKLQSLENKDGLSEISALRKSLSSVWGFVYPPTHYTSAWSKSLPELRCWS